MNIFANKILEYFKTLDSSLENLSKMQEKKITGLPSWALSYRDIYLGIWDNENSFIIKAIPNENLAQDNLTIIYPKNDLELNKICAPWSAPFSFSSGAEEGAIQIGDLSVEGGDNPFDEPISLLKGLFGVYTKNHFDKIFNINQAKRDAFNMWNSALNKFPQKGDSFIGTALVIFLKFKFLIRRKAFLERRIHRYINSYRFILLPQHKNCFFEKKLFLGKDYRIADFILEREKGMPALLIELESPSNKLFRKNGEITAEANHAKHQIAEWVKFIEQYPENRKVEMDFLNGKKQRMVIMGRGMEHLDKMIDSKYSDTTLWTYELFLREAKERLNSIISEQCKIIGINSPKEF